MRNRFLRKKTRTYLPRLRVIWLALPSWANVEVGKVFNTLSLPVKKLDTEPRKPKITY